MDPSFYFYDLETSGINPREQRIMQFAGQRTTMDLEPIGKPNNVLIKLADDILPDPDAILVTGITPQQTINEGVTEAEFLKIFNREIATPNTIFVGYNTVRFDDEFMRYLHYRNFYDAYEWHWQDGKSRWDLLDVGRMTRALRPEGINWPVDEKGRATNRLELLTKQNNLEHSNAHDALSDVNATIALAKLIKQKQPKLFEYLLKMRSKSEVEKLIKTTPKVVYSSGKYPSETEKTTIVTYFAVNPKSGVLVYDLRHDPKTWQDMSPDQLADAWRWRKDVLPDDPPRLPIKTLQFNRCPAVAPYTVLDGDSKQRLKLDEEAIKSNLANLKNNPDFVSNVLKALNILNEEQSSAFGTKDLSSNAESQLYNGFFGVSDKTQMKVVASAKPSELAELELKFKDGRLNELLPHYIARNFPEVMGDIAHQDWESYRQRKFYSSGENSQAKRFFERLNKLSLETNLSKEKQFLLQELQLYAESILPEPE